MKLLLSVLFCLLFIGFSQAMSHEDEVFISNCFANTAVCCAGYDQNFIDQDPTLVLLNMFETTMNTVCKQYN